MILLALIGIVVAWAISKMPGQPRAAPTPPARPLRWRVIFKKKRPPMDVTGKSEGAVIRQLWAQHICHSEVQSLERMP